MVRGLYISAVGMMTQMNKMDVLSNNLANVNTAGFKKDSVATQSFTEELMVRLHDRQSGAYRHERATGPFSSGVTVDEVYTDFSNGRIRATSDPFALAIAGNGLFAVSTTDLNGAVTERYTRDGNFIIDGQRMLRTTDGGQVLGQGGPIILPEGNVTFDRNGNIIVNGQYLDTLRLVNVTNPESLRKYGVNYYDITPESVQGVFDGELLQGYIEDSNVNSVMEMVELINVSRIYEANQRFVTTMDATLAKAVNDVGRK